MLVMRVKTVPTTRAVTTVRMVTTVKMGTIAMMVTMSRMVTMSGTVTRSRTANVQSGHNGHSRFFAPEQAEKVQTYKLQKKSSSGQRTQLPTAKWGECAKEFATAASGANNEAFVTRFGRPRMFILFAKLKLPCSTSKMSLSQSPPSIQATTMFSLQTLQQSYSSTPASTIILLTW